MQCGSTVAYTGGVTRAVALLLALVTACVQSGEVACEDGRTCPPGNTCDLANHRCLAPDQTTACIGLADDTACMTSAFAGFCQAGACEPVECGDGLRTGPEVCDGADLGNATCITAGFYAGDAVACTQACTLDTSACSGRCGDAIVNGDELCDGAPPAGTCVDFGFDAGVLGCSSECSAQFAACDAIGWRSEPTPLDAIADLAGSSPDELWAVGSIGTAGAIAHYAGHAWHLVATEPGLRLTAVAEAGPDDVWAIGGPPLAGATTVVHVTGGVATVVLDAPTAKPRGLRALSPTDVYLATGDVGVQRWDGSAWQAVGALTGATRLVAGTSDSDLWTADAAGTPQHWDGTTWTPSPAGMAATRLVPLPSGSVWALGTTTVATGAPSAVAHFDGTSWTAIDPGPVVALRSIAVSNDNDVWLMEGAGTGHHFDGRRWATTGRSVDLDRNSGMTAMQPFAGTVVGVSGFGVAYRYTGRLYARLDTGNVGLLDGILTLPSGEILTSNTEGEVLHFDGNLWTAQPVGARPNGVTLLFATRADDIWVFDGTAKSLLQFDGATWATRDASGNLRQVWAASPTDAYLAGADVRHWDGVSVVTVLAGRPGGSSSVTGTSATDVWMTLGVTGLGADLYHWNGATLAPGVHVDEDLSRVVAAGPNSVFAIARSTHVMHYDGASWTDTGLPSPEPLIAMAAVAPDDVFAASPTSLFHYDGTQWTPVRVPADPNIGQATIQGISAIPGALDVGFAQMIFEQPVRRLLQTRPLACRAHETACGDGVDDDCDGLVDSFDPDCAP